MTLTVTGNLMVLHTEGVPLAARTAGGMSALSRYRWAAIRRSPL